jgi:hypothetical protein
MPTTKITSNVLAPDAALNNLNAGSSVALSVPLSSSKVSVSDGTATEPSYTFKID